MLVLVAVSSIKISRAGSSKLARVFSLNDCEVNQIVAITNRARGDRVFRRIAWALINAPAPAAGVPAES